MELPGFESSQESLVASHKTMVLHICVALAAQLGGFVVASVAKRRTLLGFVAVLVLVVMVLVVVSCLYSIRYGA
jgi:predicted MFS family arabinose efflux permease